MTKTGSGCLDSLINCIWWLLSTLKLIIIFSQNYTVVEKNTNLPSTMLVFNACLYINIYIYIYTNIEINYIFTELYRRSIIKY